MQVPRRSDEKEAKLGMETLELKSGEKIKVLNSACMAEIKDNLPVLSGKVGGKKVEVLRDTGCSGVIIKKELVDETNFTEEMGHIMTVDRTLKRAPMAKVEVDTPFYVGTLEALCLQNSLFDLIIRNVPGARRSDDPNAEWGVVMTMGSDETITSVDNYDFIMQPYVTIPRRKLRKTTHRSTEPFCRQSI